ncbi:MAG TPA: methyltransferase [Verrucomicrobiae bacterium]|nr:methyltransferase [Verrucomicrobiae bacterium]
MIKTLNRRAALAAVYAERYVLSLVYLYFAWVEFHKLWLIWLGPASNSGTVALEAARHVIALMLNFFVGILLFLGRRADVPPQTRKDILIPLATSFFNLTYNATPWFPAWLRTSLCSTDWQTPLTAIGLFLGLAGPAVAIWAVLYLGRSFGVFVVVRKVVLDGPYQRVRHPIYLGYLCMLAGLVLVNFSAAYFILVSIHIALLLYRAHLEEVRLSEHSPEYREYMKRTGFIFPRLRRPALDQPERGPASGLR